MARKRPAPPALTDEQRAVLRAYRLWNDVREIAEDLDMAFMRAARILVPLLFDTEGDIDDAVAAPNHGRGYSPRQRDDLIDLYNDGIALPVIAEIAGRTQLAVALQLIEHDDVPIPPALERLLDDDAPVERPPRDAYRVRLHGLVADIAAMQLPRRAEHQRWGRRRTRRALRWFFALEPLDIVEVARVSRRTVPQTMHHLVDVLLDDIDHAPLTRGTEALRPAHGIEIMARYRAGASVGDIAARMNLHRDEVGALVLLEAEGHPARSRTVDE